jgi:hypothetical protein
MMGRGVVRGAGAIAELCDRRRDRRAIEQHPWLERDAKRRPLGGWSGGGPGCRACSGGAIHWNPILWEEDHERYEPATGIDLPKSALSAPHRRLNEKH